MNFPPYTRPDPTMLDAIADLLLVGSGFGILTFALLYLIFFNWRETPSGKAILYFALSLGLLILLVLAGRFTGGDYPGRDLLRVFVYALIFASTWGLVATLVRAWRRGEKPLELVERENMRRPVTGPTAFSQIDRPQGASMPPTNSMPNLASIIASVRIRRAVYAVFGLAVLLTYSIGAYFDAVDISHPDWLKGAFGVLLFLAAPMAGLALANAPSSSTTTVAVVPPETASETTIEPHGGSTSVTVTPGHSATTRDEGFGG